MTAPPAVLDAAIGQAIRAARFSRGLTQQDLAARLGVTRATVASYERGRRKVPAETLIAVAHICDLPLSFFNPREAGAPPQGRPPAAPLDANLTLIVEALQARPDAVPFVLELLEAFLSPPPEAPPGD